MLLCIFVEYMHKLQLKMQKIKSILHKIHNFVNKIA